MEIEKDEFPEIYSELERLFDDFKGRGVPLWSCRSQKPAALGFYKETENDRNRVKEEFRFLLDLAYFANNKGIICPVLPESEWGEGELLDLVYCKSLLFAKTWKQYSYSKRAWGGLGKVIESGQKAYQSEINISKQSHNLPQFLTASLEKTIVHPITMEELEFLERIREEEK